MPFAPRTNTDAVFYSLCYCSATRSIPGAALFGVAAGVGAAFFTDNWCGTCSLSLMKQIRVLPSSFGDLLQHCITSVVQVCVCVCVCVCVQWMYELTYTKLIIAHPNGHQSIDEQLTRLLWHVWYRRIGHYVLRYEPVSAALGQYKW